MWIVTERGMARTAWANKNRAAVISGQDRVEGHRRMMIKTARGPGEGVCTRVSHRGKNRVKVTVEVRRKQTGKGSNWQVNGLVGFISRASDKGGRTHQWTDKLPKKRSSVREGTTPMLDRGGLAGG